MKTIPLFVLAIIIMGCSKQSVIDYVYVYPVNVHFHEGFYNYDSAAVLVNGHYLLSVDSLWTNAILGFAASRKVNLTPGTYLLSVLIPRDSVRVDRSFVHSTDELWIGITYQRGQHTISVVIQNSPFFYR